VDSHGALRAFVGAQPDPVGDVVLGDDQVLSRSSAPGHDMAVRMAGVEVLHDRDPVEPCAEILFHLPHHVAGEAAQVRQPIAILRRNDEPELANTQRQPRPVPQLAPQTEL
jgi:hypothetical protein